MGLPSLASHRSHKSPSLKSPSEGAFKWGSAKQPVKSPLSHSFSSSPAASLPSSPADSKTFSSPATSPASASFSPPKSFSASFSARSAHKDSPQSSPTVPSSLVFRDLDRYPKIVRPTAPGQPDQRSPPPLPSPSSSRPFPKRQSSVKSSRSLLSPSTLNSPTKLQPVRAQVNQFQAVRELPDESGSDTNDAGLESRNSSVDDSSTSLSFHTPADSVGSELPSPGGLGADRRDAFGVNSSSESSTSSLPLKAVEVRVTAQTGPDTTPRKIRISSSIDSKGSLDLSSSPGSIPTSATRIPGPSMSESVFDLEYNSETDDDVFRTAKRPPGTTSKSLKAMQTQMKKLHMPEYNLSQIKTASSDAFSNIKSNLRDRNATTTTSKSMAQYNYDLVEALETDVRNISAELAASIKRELDLEMVLDKYATTNDVEGDLTDGNSSLLEDNEESDAFRLRLRYSPERFEELERRLRVEQQDKARQRLEFQSLLDRERQGRRECEQRRQKLEDQLRSKSKSSKKDALITANGEANETIKALETALEEAQRKLHNERSNAQNLEFMLTGLREELQDMSEKPPAERAQRARSSILSMDTIQRLQIQPEMSPNSMDPASVTSRIENLEAQRVALQEALRSLKERHDLQVKTSSEKIKALHNQLNRSRDLAKAISSRRLSNERDMTNFKEKLDQMKLQLSCAQREKKALESSLGELKQSVLDMDNERSANESRALQSAESEAATKYMARIDELNNKITQQTARIKSLTNSFEQERYDFRKQIKSLTDRLKIAEETQREAVKVAEERQILIRTMSANRRKMKEEHDKMTRELEDSSRKFEEFASQIQTHLASNRTLASKLSSSLLSSQ